MAEHEFRCPMHPHWGGVFNRPCTCAALHEEWARYEREHPKLPTCELCGEPAGEGNALCPACQEEPVDG